MATINDAIAFNNNNLICDFHAHPSLKPYLFDTELNKDSLVDGFIETRLPQIKAGGTNLMFSSAYLPERPLVESSRYLDILESVTSALEIPLASKVEKNSNQNEPFTQTQLILEGFRRKVDEAAHQYNCTIATSNADLDAKLRIRSANPSCCHLRPYSFSS